MYLYLILLVFGAASAELDLWDISNCPVVNDSARPNQKEPRECEYVCDGISCQINIAIILPSDDYYIVNQNRSLEELDKAIEYAKNTNIIPQNLKIRIMPYDDKCDQAYATIATIDAYSEYCAHVIFGPICDYCLASTGRIVKFLNSYGTPVITPGGFSFDFVVQKTGYSDEFFMLINTGLVDYQSLAEFFYLILKKYEWRKIALLYEKYDQNEVGGSQGCQLLMKSLMEIIKNGLTGFQHSDGDISLSNITYEEYLRRDVGVKYGIIPVCASHPNTRKILLEAEKIRMTESGEYVFFSFDLYNNAPIPSKPWLDPEDTAENNDLARKAYKSLFIFSPWIEADYAERNETVDDRRGMIYLDGIYDGFILYSHILNNILFKNKNDTTQIPRDVVLKGVDVVSQMFGYQFQGKREQITINCNGQRVAKYALMQMNNEGSFHIVAEYSTLDKTLVMKRNVTWVGGQRPDDTPRCGYDNSKCPSSKINTMFIIGTFFAVISVSLCVIIVYKYQKYKVEMAMTWKITDVEGPYFTNVSTESLFSQILLNLEDYKSFTPRMDHRNESYAAIMLDTIKPDSFTTKQLMELRSMKNLSHHNLAKFHGIYFNSPKSWMLTEYCNRGSLEDVLKKFKFNSTLSFKLAMSLIIDLISGMRFLHSSDIKFHGSLRTSKCLVDGRFVLKVSDFGLEFLRRKKDKRVSEDYRLLWSAPEVLRNENLDILQKQKADVYSFGIIVHEIIVTKGPFYLGEKVKKTAAEIVEAVKKPESGNSQPLRPLIDDKGDKSMIDMMQKCWAEEATDRPDFNALKKIIRNINRDNGNEGNLLDDLLTRMEQYANTLETLVDERTQDYLEEKRRCEELLYQLLPKYVAQQLIVGRSVIAETFDQVTIYFSDIVGFTNLSAQSTPLEVVDLLNDLYTCFDRIIEGFDVYKVETIGDAYMVVSGLPQRNHNKHAVEIARMSLALLAEVREFKIKHRPDEPLKLRIGMHTGPCVAGIVGLKMPRYCLFGDTVNTASRMESNGEPFKIHVSEATKKILDTFETFVLECRGEIDIKGKGKMTTYWLQGERGNDKKEEKKPPNPTMAATKTILLNERNCNTNGNSLSTVTTNHDRDEASIPLLSIVIPDNQQSKV